uniref:Phage protein n=1 Tax=Dulem virus 36 TaxID=3145754 RepID=A0AAU8B0A7_9CAUD
MQQTEFIGMLVIAATTLIGLLAVIYRPLSENTKAMTMLTIRVEELTKQMKKQEDELKEYKEHVSESQQKQWDTINRHTEEISAIKAKLKED